MSPCGWRRRRRGDLLGRRPCSLVCAASVVILFFKMCLLRTPAPLGAGPAAKRTDRAGAVTVLLWTPPFGHHQPLPDCQARFRVSGCALTDDRGAYPRADAVLVHHREIAGNASALPPEPRPRGQKWVWMNFESPTHTRDLWRFDGLFNLTMSYRGDSDIFLPYGYLVPFPRTAQYGLALPGQRSRLRPGLVAWVISNWSESHARVAFFRELSRHIRVDVYGRAGRPLPHDGGRDSVVRVVKRYQFYLALENSQHTDYITEKLWNALLAGAVPVVLGPTRDNYERFLPPQAFIHVDDFPSAAALARYLLLLRRDPARLRRHLDWRKSYGVHMPRFWAEQYCMACRAVAGARHRTSVVADLEDWFQS